MVIVYQEKEIATLEDIQKLKVKDLKEILRSNSEATGGMKADLVLLSTKSALKSLRDLDARHASAGGESPGKCRTWRRF